MLGTFSTDSCAPRIVCEPAGIAWGGSTVDISDICDGTEFAEFLGQTIAGWCRSPGLGFVFTLNDMDMEGNIKCHSSKTVSQRAHRQPAGSKASL
jgi:hypothetical protein